MRVLSIFLCLLFGAGLTVDAQYYTSVVNYSTNAAPKNGLKIKTNLPFSNYANMPSMDFLGFAFGTNEPFRISLNYYIANDTFYNAVASTNGAFNPPIYLASESGKVVIFLDTRVTGVRFNIRAFSQGNSQDLSANFTGWTVVDTTLFTTAQATKQVAYINKFAGTVVLPDSVISTGDGKFGIGTLNPRASLDVATAMNDTLTSVFGRLQSGNTTGTGTYIGTRSYSATSYFAPMFGLVAAYGGKENAKIIFNKGNGASGDYLTFHTNDGSEQMRIDKNGNVGIGTNNPGSFKLAVEGTLGARKVKVQATAWADFVFHPRYQLPSLYEVEKYISDNHHLPDIPAEAEVLEKGIDVAEMNKLLLQKVEELTLYLIEEHKSNDALRRDNEELKNNVKKIMEMLSASNDK